MSAILTAAVSLLERGVARKVARGARRMTKISLMVKEEGCRNFWVMIMMRKCRIKNFMINFKRIN